MSRPNDGKIIEKNYPEKLCHVNISEYLCHIKKYLIDNQKI